MSDISLLINRYECHTAEIVKQSHDMVNIPIVINGYMRSGKPSATVFMNLQAMAQSRVRKYFMLADPKDPLIKRLIAEVKKICAECIVKKYEARENRISYNHIRDADIKTHEWMKLNLDSLKREFTEVCNDRKSIKC